MQTLRKLVFYVLTVVYVILCPLIILYAFGYIYKPDAPNGVAQTGVIYLATVPEGAAVHINESLYPQSTPALLKGLLPGKYFIQIALDGYLPWVRTLPVAIEKATVMDKILLVPGKREKKKLLSGNIRDLIPLEGNQFFLVKSGDMAGDIRVYDFGREEVRFLFEPGSLFDKCRLLECFLASKSPAGLFYVDSPEGKKFFWIWFERKKDAVKDVTGLFQTLPYQVEWLARQETRLFSFQGGSLNRLDLDSGAVYPEYIRNVRGYGLFNGKIYVLKDNNIFLKMGYDAKPGKVLLDDPALGQTIFGGKGTYRVKVLAEDFILFLGERGELLANRLPYRFVEKGVKGVESSQLLQQVLVWQKGSIGILDFSSEETGSVEFEKGPQLTWIYSGGKNIEQCFWVYEDSHVLFRDSDNVFLIEVKAYEDRGKNWITRVKAGTSVYYSDDTGDLYFIEPSTGELMSINIVPSRSLMPQSSEKQEKKLGKELDMETKKMEHMQKT